MQEYEQLEVELGQRFSEAHVVACSSGTAALHLALEALCLPQGSEVLVPEFTMVACARAVTLAGLVPIFVDCEPNSLLIDVKQAKRKCGPSVRAVLAVHIYGRRCDMANLHSWALDKGVVVIEDLAEAHGLERDSYSEAGCWSFYKNKVVCGEEGGAVAFRDPAQAARARSLRSLGFTAQHDFMHTPRGHNYRLSNLHAAPIRQSLARLNENLALRRQVVGWYDGLVQDDWHQQPRAIPWVYDLRIPGLTVAQQYKIIEILQERGVAARHAFKPMSCLLEYVGKPGAQPLEKLVELQAWKAACEVLYLPVLPTMQREDVQAVVGLFYGACRAAGIP